MPLTKYPANAGHAIGGSCLLFTAAPGWTAMRHQVTRICSRVELHFQCMHIYVRTCVYVCVCLCVSLQSRKHQFILFILSMLKKSDFCNREHIFFLKRNIEGLQKLLRYKKGVCVCVCICVSSYIYICILTRNSDSTEEMPTPVFCTFTPHGSLGFGFVTKSLRSVHGT